MKKPTSVSFGLCCFLVLASCDQKSDPPAAETGQILFVGKTFSNPYFVEMAKAVAQAGKSANINVITRSGAEEDDVRGQQILIEGFLADRSDRKRGIILAPASSGADFNRLIKEANAQAIPVVIVDTEIPQPTLSAGGARVLTTIASDNYQGATAAAQLVSRMTPACGTVLLLVGVPQQATAVDRSRGFTEGLHSEGAKKGCEYGVVRRIANWNRDEARRIVAAMIPLRQKFVAVFGSNDQMALGAVEAFEQAPRHGTKPIFVGFDAVPEAVAAVQNGRLNATMRQQPDRMGAAAVNAVRQSWTGSGSPPAVRIPVKPVTR
jgi:ribose transport system substrate-binding protein